MTTKDKFFEEVQKLAESHGVVAYIVVGAVERESSLVIATAAGTRMKEETAVTEKVYTAMADAFERGMTEIIRGPAGSPGLLN